MTKNQAAIISELLSIPGNNICADCHASNPRYVSTKFGIFICQGCSKYHQTLNNGQNCIKSIDNDSFTRYNLDMLKQAGNQNSNKYYEYSLPSNFNRPNPNNSKEMLEFIQNKYDKKKWSDKNKFSPTNFKFLNSKIVTDLRVLTSATVKLFILALFVIFLILLLILKRCGLILLIKAISLAYIIVFEIISLMLNNDIFYLSFGLFAEFIFGAISFGKYKSITILLSAKIIEVGINGKSVNWPLLFIAAALIYFGFGFWASFSTMALLGSLIFILI